MLSDGVLNPTTASGASVLSSAPWREEYCATAVVQLSATMTVTSGSRQEIIVWVRSTLHSVIARDERLDFAIANSDEHCFLRSVRVHGEHQPFLTLADERFATFTWTRWITYPCSRSFQRSLCIWYLPEYTERPLARSEPSHAGVTWYAVPTCVRYS